VSKALDPAVAAQLLKTAEAQSKERAATGRKSKAIVTEPREYSVWFKLSTHFGNCANPTCGDPRERKTEEGNTMVAMVNGSEICRYCFLAGVNPTVL
jgi:hypothetical protein